MKRMVLKIAAVPMLAFLIPAGPASAVPAPLHFQPAQVNGTTPGCSGKVNAEVAANQGQRGGDHASFIDSSTRVTVNFTPDPNPLGSISGGPGGNCEISTTVTIRNLNTGAHKTETRTTQYDGHYGWHAAFFTLNGSGRVAVKVSTNPNPAELTIDVPAPR